MPPPLTPQDEEDERRRLLESVDYAALDGLAGATSPVTRGAPPASRDDGVIRPFAEPITIGRSEPETAVPAADASASPDAERWVDPRSSTAPGRRGPWPDAPGSRRVGNTVAYAPGTLPLPPRAQAIEERLRNGEADDVAVETTAAIDAAPPIPPQETPISPLAPRSSPATDEPEPEPEPDADVEERAMAALAGQDMSAQPPVELASLRPQAAALGSPVATPPDEPEDVAVEKPEAAVKEGPQGLIPGEDELASARAGDVPRRLLHNLANAFRAMGGRPANREFVRDEDRVRAQQRQMLGDKRTALGDERRTNEQAMTRALQQRQMDQRDEHQRSQLELASRNADRQDQMSQAQMSRLLEQTQSERSERERADRLTDPASPESARSRTVLEGLVSSLPPGDRARVTEALGRSEDGQTLAIDGLSAQDLESLREDMPRYLRNGLRAGRGTTGGGGGGGGGQTATALRSAIVDRIAGPNATPEQRATAEQQAGAMISALGIRRAASTVLTDALSRTRSDEAAARQDARADATRERQAQGPELIPGSGIRAGGDLATGEDARWRDGYSHALTSMSSFRRVQQIGERFGRTGAINPEARAALNPELVGLRAMVAQMGSTGVINPSEVPAINAALPNPSDPEQATFETFNARLLQWRSILEDGVRARATTLGVDQPGQQRLIQGLRTGRIPRPAPAAGEARVLMIFPNGQRGRVPESQVQAAIDSRGARRAE